MAELILKHKDLVIDILEHDTLLQNNEAEELDEDDRNAAWDDYQKEKEAGFRWTQPAQPNVNIQMNNTHQQNTLLANSLSKLKRHHSCTASFKYSFIDLFLPVSNS